MQRTKLKHDAFAAPTAVQVALCYPRVAVLGAKPGRGGVSVQLIWGFPLGARRLMACESSDLTLTASD